eukprot:3543804-Prymnesium_polylepis.4
MQTRQPVAKTHLVKTRAPNDGRSDLGARHSGCGLSRSALTRVRRCCRPSSRSDRRARRVPRTLMRFAPLLSLIHI